MSMKLRQYAASNPCPFVIVSCYTPAYLPIYTRHLGKSLGKDVDPLYDDCSMVFEVASTGSWIENCLLKPEVIALARQLTSKPIIWVDADAEIPDIDALGTALRGQINAGQFDFAAYAPGIAKSDDHDSRVNSNLMSGTLIFMPTPRANSLLLDWLQACNRMRDGGTLGPAHYDQEILFAVLKKSVADGLVFRNLNPTWVKVHDFFPTITHPLVEHFQASRTMKDTVR